MNASRTEDDLRAALVEVSQNAPAPADVLPDRSGVGRSRHLLRWLAPAAAAVTAAAVAIAVAVIGHAPTRPMHPGIAGYRWTVTQLTDHRGRLAVHDRLVVVAFTRDGYLLGDDGCNSLQARYRLRDGGYAAYDGVESYNLCIATAGSPAGRIKHAVDAMFNLDSPRSAGRDMPNIESRVHGSSLHLTSVASGTTVVAVKAGKQPNFVAGRLPSSSPAPSPR